MKVFVCKNQFEDMMSCIYDAWSTALTCGHDNVYLMREPIFQGNILDEYIYTECDSEKATKVIRSVSSKMGEGALMFIQYASLSHEEDALDAIYRFMIRGFKIGHGITNALTEPAVIRIMELRRNVGNEAHFFREFVRFTSVDNRVYISHIEPKNKVLELVGIHFADRMPSEHFIIIDDTRKLALVHPKDEESYLQILTDEELKLLVKTDTVRDEYTSMWKAFFDAIAIRERTNKKCQRNMLPLWMRKHMIEFMD